MENFVLYETIGETDDCVIYKGRRKGTVIFLAIYCVNKSQRAEVTNQVRLTHEVKHEKIQQFYEWYETSNHLWLVLELCTGGTLEKLILQDGALPESCVRDFGKDLVEGLHAIHSLGMVFCDLKPAKLLLDGEGGMKYSDFRLARAEGENLEELLSMFGQQNSNDEESEYESGSDPSSDKQKTFNKGSPQYMAPEVIQGAPHTQKSDLWSLGCVLYEMFTGCRPFEGESFTDLINKIIHVDHQPPSVKGSRFSAKPSPDFVDLLDGLLKKDPAQRFHWDQVALHPFWHDSLKHLSSEPESLAASIKIDTDMRCATPLTRRASSNLLEHSKAGSVLGHIKDVELRHSIDRPLSTLETAGELTDSLRPKSRQGKGAGEMDSAKFTISNRPPTSHGKVEIEEVEFTPQKPLVKTDLNVSEIIYYTNDWLITSIFDNNKVQKLPALKFDQKSLQLPAHTLAKLNTMNKGDREKHLKTMSDLLSAEEKGPTTQKRAHLLTYATIVGSQPAFADFLVHKGLINILTKQLKDAQHIDLRMKIGRLISCLAANSDDISNEVSHNEAITMLTDMLRENFRNAKLKSILLPTLGEILFLTARIQEHNSESVTGSQQQLSSLTFTMVLKCLKEGDDAITHHYAAKTIENIVATNSDMCQRFINNDVGQALWYLCTHSSVDAPRITALSALCRITKHSVSAFESVIEKAGFPNLLNTINTTASARSQQAYVTMLCEVVCKGQYKQKYMQQKELFSTALHLLESTSCVVRGKAFVLIYILIQDDNDQLLSLCQSRLVMYIERDKKKQHQTEKPEQQNQVTYLLLCLNTLLTELLHRIPYVLGDLLQLLNTISGRKHLSATQAKHVKNLLPVVQLIQNLITSSVFRPYLINEEFILSIARLLEHTVSIDCGETGVSAPGVASVSREEFIHIILSVVETLMQHPSIIAEYQRIMTTDISKPLASLCLSEQGDTKLLALKLFCELTSVFANTECLTRSQQEGANRLISLINKELLPQYEQLLMDLNPIPSYSLKLLEHVISFHPAIAKEIISCGLFPVLTQVIEENHSNPLSQVLQHSLAVLCAILHCKDINLNDMYNQGVVELLLSVSQKIIPYLRDRTDQSELHIPTLTLVSTLDAVHHLLKILSEVVRKALQAQKGGDSNEADSAEDSLHNNRQFAEIISLLPSMVAFDDSQISDLSLRVLSLLVQLFAGENRNSLDQTNLNYYNETLTNGDNKRQKFILRIIKRLVTTEKHHLMNLKNHGSDLIKTLTKLTKTGSVHADAGLTSMAQELLRLVSS